MTARESLTRQMRRWSIVWLAGLGTLLLTASSLTLDVPMQRMMIGLALVGFLVFAVGLVAIQFGVRCPRCSGALGPIAASMGIVFWFPKRIRFCAYCGLDLDTPLDAVAAAPRER